MPIDSLLAALDRGDTAALARAISLVENQRDGFESLLGHMHARAGTARRVGITGPPGAGKSTLIERLVQTVRGAGRRVAVVAVDPTSPFTGGALLGDRIRMESVSTDPGVFIRSMATRGSVGGLATTTEEVADVLDGAGFDRIVIETVGIGQTELDVARTAQTTALVLVPESGDGIQTLKAGVMEVADVFVINKSDRPGADRLKAEVEAMLALRAGGRAGGQADGPVADGLARPPVRPPARPVWKPPVILTVATTGDGVTELAAALDAHHAYLERTGGLAEWRRRRLAERTRAIVNRALRQWLWEETRAEALLAERLDAVARGSRNPYEVAAEILDQLKSEVPR
jgi:LAO/AO transport system kinase